jgi:type I restriction-modification system DNA methylase subunit
MTQYEQAPLSAKPFQNSLFADHYLLNIMPELPEWIAIDARDAFEQIRDLRAKIQPEALDEAQLEEQWAQPIFRLLGLHYAVQVKIRYRDQGHRRPDYVFVATEAEARALSNEIYDPQAITHVLAVGDVKRWGSKLDQSTATQRNPSQQIDEYLRYSERPWGILTDGKIWRLYHRDSSKYNVYYAVDLDALLSGSLENFGYFYAFFRLEAFTTGWLERVLKGSEDFAQRLSDKLEGAVFEALELIAQGFLEYRRNRLTPASLRQIYEQSLVLLYRLLFVFYAESREILPLDNEQYRRLMSMESIKREVANHFRFNAPLPPARLTPPHSQARGEGSEAAGSAETPLPAFKPSPPAPLPQGEGSLKVPLHERSEMGMERGRGSLSRDNGHYYTRLADLFFAIDSGSRDYDVPPYNGRLFSDREHPFLAENAVGDLFLAPALDKLARVDDNGKRVFVDYRDLDARHLGSIYERLLEYELDIAREPLTTKGKEERYAPAKEGDPIVKNVGEVYLRTGNNERKVTGSYYTPDYIARFIVEKTLEPLLTAITARHADADAEGRWHVRDAESLAREVLALNILDPATGSGHFVVDATAYIAEWLRRLGMRPADLGDEDELVYWKRQVASACIYAVDINPLAVELAKLSMWLTTLAKGKPLSFLDHHIRVGNSLVGTRMSAIDDTAVAVKEEEKRRKALERQRKKEAATGQMGMFSDADFSAGVGFAVQQMSAIENTIADDVSDVKKQEQMYAGLTQRLSAWKQAADVWTARYFGLELTAEQWKTVREMTTNGAVSPAVQKILDEAAQIAEAHKFFHWELAFPEIFYDADGQPKAAPGFDAVMGNPPYVRQERIQPIKPFLQSHYAVYSGTADLFLYFYERGIGFLKPEHRLGYITSGTYMNSNSAKPFRQYIHENIGLEWVANFGENQPFRGAEMVYPTIAIMRSGKAKDTFRNLFIEGNVPYAQLGEAIDSGEWVDSLSEATGMDEWRFQPAELTRLFQKLKQGRTTLGEYVNGNIFYGIKTGFNEAFIIDSATRQRLINEHHSSADIIKPMLRGEDLRPWYQIDSGEYLIVTQRETDIDAYPAIKLHLEQYKESLQNRAAQTHWYALQTTASYLEMFEKPKIYWPEIAKLPRMSLDVSSYYANNKCYFVGSNKNSLTSLLSLMQSRILWFCASQVATPLRLRAGLWQYQLFRQFVERLPIPELSADHESSLAAIAEEITALARERYQLHEDMRSDIRARLRGGEINSRVGLYRWWELADEQALSDEAKRLWGREIPLGALGEWRKHLAMHKETHKRLTAQIVALETRLNAIVYDAFLLDAAERDLIERTTKYPYGEV